MTEAHAVSIRVDGRPITQGSKSVGLNCAQRRAGTCAGRVSMWEQTSADLRTWREAVRLQALVAWRRAGHRVAASGPVGVALEFRMRRPASSRDVAPMRVRSGDVDKLARAVLDALTGPVLVDDAQVTELSVRKRWAVAGEQPGVRVVVWLSVHDARSRDPQPRTTTKDPTPTIGPGPSVASD